MYGCVCADMCVLELIVPRRLLIGNGSKNSIYFAGTNYACRVVSVE